MGIVRGGAVGHSPSLPLVGQSRVEYSRVEELHANHYYALYRVRCKSLQLTFVQVKENWISTYSQCVALSA